jgi:hypothetical protein
LARHRDNRGDSPIRESSPFQSELACTLRTRSGSTALRHSSRRPNCYGPNVKERTHARVVRHQRQHLVSSRRTRDQANHTRPIEVCHSIRADVSAAAVVDGLAVQQHGHRDAARGSRLHDQVHLPSSEWEQNLVCAPSELDVLTFGSPVALERDTTGLASVSSNIRRIRDPRVTRQRPARVCCPVFERRSATSTSPHARRPSYRTLCRSNAASCFTALIRDGVVLLEWCSIRETARSCASNSARTLTLRTL